MLEPLRAPLLRLLKVPPEPHVPGGGTPVRVFRAAPAYFRYRLALWGLAQLGALVGLLFGLAFIYTGRTMVTGTGPGALLVAAEVLAWAVFLVQLPLGLAVLRLDWDMRWYILSDRSLRIREGVVRLQEKTMTFANIQHISIRQNPLQRMLGIADVQVRTAGGGASEGGGGKHPHVGEGMHEAFFRGVDNAEEIRSAIRQRVRVQRGEGEPGAPAGGQPVPRPEATGAPAAAGRAEASRLAAAPAPGARMEARRLAATPTPAGDDLLAAARALRAEVGAWRRLRP